jgi:ribonucleoside-diphosphate reductase alpha chain
MMAAVQPFLSGAISKTVNMPEESTPEDIADAYLEAWRLGIKAIAIYRDASKRTQPLNTADVKKKSGVRSQESGAKEQGTVSRDLGTEAESRVPNAESGRAERRSAPGVSSPEPRVSSPTSAPKPFRRKLPDERKAITHKFSVGGHEGYLHVGLYDDGQPGEIFITMAKEGSTISGLMDSFATAVSLALQYGVPLKVLCDKFSHTRFEPSGWSTNSDIGYAKSLMDYIFRWLALKFLPVEAQPKENVSLVAPEKNGLAEAAKLATQFTRAASEHQSMQSQLAGVKPTDDAPSCADCGAIMVRNGSCYRCMNCGSTSGCS